MLKIRCVACFISVTSFGIYAAPVEIESLDLDDLMATDVQITSAMKRAQSASETAASIYVLSHDEIASSGVTSVAEALTLIPGVQARKINNQKWAISIRGVGGRYSSKLLVMIDGQSVYNPGFAGVYWESLNLPVYDIERIEVIRGQGGILWGSNATNGVVNIITKHTLDTRGVRASIGAGSELKSNVDLRWGAEWGERSSYRVHANSTRSDASDRSRLGRANDDGKKDSLGGRLDINPNDNLSIIAQVDFSRTDNGHQLLLPNLATSLSELHEGRTKREHQQAMLRLDHRYSDTTNQMLQATYSSQKGEQALSNEDLVSYDLDYQMNMLWGGTQLDWGINYRLSTMPVIPSPYFQSDNFQTQLRQYGVFVQSQFDVHPDVHVNLGIKAEHNNLTGWENQPAARVVWQVAPQHTLWSALSKGVRIPSLSEYDYNVKLEGIAFHQLVTTGIPDIDQLIVPSYLNGNDSLGSEHSISAELGYRYAQSAWKVDLSVFYTNAQNVSTLKSRVDEQQLALGLALLGQGNTDAALEALQSLEFIFDLTNQGEQISQGGELVVQWQPSVHWTSELGYSFNKIEKESLPEGFVSSDVTDFTRQLYLKGSVQLNAQHALFAQLRHESGQSFFTKDHSLLRLNCLWKVTPNLSFSTTGQSLLFGSHLEFGNVRDSFAVATFDDHSVELRATLSF